MSMHDTKRRGRNWTVPAVAAVIGVGYLIAGVLGDDLRFGIFGLLLMLAVAGAMMLAGRSSETVQGLLDRRDERIRGIDNEATMFAGMAVIVAIIVGFMVEIARGQDGLPYAVLGAIGGVTYVAAVVYLRFRR
ncbi:MAG TPA: hypothetical protein VFJ14_10210 [Nocardioidaceae bacterium]|nr:hypothetical protein [Nocardioidaceae bacterium]